MDNMITRYFNGVQFVLGGCTANHTGYITRQVKDHYSIQYSQDGEFQVDIGGAGKWAVKEEWALITYPGPVFRYGAPPGRKRLHAFICFKGPRVKSYIKTGLLPINPHNPMIRITRPAHFLETLRQLIVLINPLTGANYARAVHKLEDLLLQLHEQPTASGQFPEYLRAGFMKLAAQINETPEHDWSFTAAAGTLNISYTHFRRLFRHHSGMAPGHFLIAARLRKAAGYLIATDLQMKMLAEQCGFHDNLYFSRMFKKYYRLSPMQYRKEFHH